LLDQEDAATPVDTTSRRARRDRFASAQPLGTASHAHRRTFTVARTPGSHTVARALTLVSHAPCRMYTIARTLSHVHHRTHTVARTPSHVSQALLKAVGVRVCLFRPALRSDSPEDEDDQTALVSSRHDVDENPQDTGACPLVPSTAVAPAAH
jgi:hypothetical protein